MVYIGEKGIKEAKITIIDYNKVDYNQLELKEIERNLKKVDDSLVRWVNIEGITQVKIVEALGTQFDFHPLLLEDILNTEQRPKLEIYKDHIAVFLKMLFWNDKDERIESEQTTLILSENIVLSLQEWERNVFEHIKERLKTSKGLIRMKGADYLLYALIDVIVDNYFTIIEKISEKVEDLEEELTINPTVEILNNIHKLKRQMINVRKSVWPVREVLIRLQREDIFNIKNGTIVYLRDVYDHIIQINDSFENYRDIIFGLQDLYLSSVSNKMNEIMKILTIISTIFIPLSFLAGFYGMNLLMPEFSFPLAYPILIIIMSSITIIMLFFFKRKKWL